MSSLRILMYSNDSLGWGHTLRTLSVASALSKAWQDCSILVLTDLSNIGRFKLPERTDYVHLPSLSIRDHESYLNGRLNLETENTLRIRRKIAQSALRTFRPGLVIFDDSLLDIPSEMRKILSCVTDELPDARVLWGLPDTLGEPQYVMRQWRANGVLEAFEHAHEILIYGAESMCDYASAYQMPDHLARKLRYTGYLTRQVVPPQRVRVEMGRLQRNKPVVVLTAGGESSDFPLIDAYLRFLEKAEDLAVQSFVFAGPAIGSREKRALLARTQRLPNVILHRVDKHMLHYLKFADLSISTGSYNVMCEVLAHRKQALVVPNHKEQPDNYYRAKLLRERGLVTVLSPADFHPEVLREQFAKLLFAGPHLVHKAQYEALPQDGFTGIVERTRLLAGRQQHAPVAALA
ncbi:hypothetical protein HUU05_22575 [candidate division KSB1 bacterium]|nr:hypothetical protein [candidate division KSB1 bacterium]